MDDQERMDNPEQGGAAAGRKQKPANGNAWYILATVHGEQTGELIDRELHAHNRQSWNRWMSAALDDATRQALIEKHGVKLGDLAPLEPHERDEIEKLTGERLAFDELTLPDPGTPENPTRIDLSDHDFPGHFVTSGFVFPGSVDLSKATFHGEALFQAAAFRSPASFDQATFQRKAGFERTNFRRMARFDGSTFREEARFERVTFRRLVSFICATFRETAWFGRATFREMVWFDQVTFGGGAVFERARFQAWTIFDGVRFSQSPDFRDATLPFGTTWHRASWPRQRRRIAVMDTENYAALRHAMDNAKRHDAELDFYVRELQAKRYTGIPHLQRLTIEGYLLLADGGRSFARPALAWLLALLLVFLVEGVTLTGPAVFAIPSPLAFEALRLAFGSAIVVSVPMFDVRRMEQLRQALPDLTGQPLLPAGTSPLPDWIQLLGLAHAGFSALCLFLMALAIRNWLRLR